MARAQQSNHVIHLYVDPVYGEDWSSALNSSTNEPLSANAFFNPDGLGSLECPATAIGPHSVLDTMGQPLRHAAYPFRTITGAIDYINRLAPSGGDPLPHTDAVSGKTWSHCIIHLLPGWYGRAPGAVDYQPSIDKAPVASPSTGPHAQPPKNHLDSKLVANGETFPIHLPPRVSLAGTSALNTIIHTGQVGTAIVFGKVIDGAEISGIETFVDKITFYGCGGFQPVFNRIPETDPRRCAAILIDDDVYCRPTISNCVFVKNVFGVLVNAAEPDVSKPIPEAVPRHDGTTIINCTFAWNMFGLWSGQIDAGDASVGVSRLNLINNIFDGSETVDQLGSPQLACDNSARRNLGSPHQIWSWPFWGAIAGVQLSGIHSAFEGVAKEDLQVVVSGQGLVDSNAYEGDAALAGWFNYNQRIPVIAGRIASGVPLTMPRTGLQQFSPDSGRDISPLTGSPTTRSGLGNRPPRGILFITDLFCRGTHASVVAGSALPNDPNFDLSPLDFRLAPNAMLAAVPGPTAVPTMLNPLVDVGFGGPFPALMANGNTVQRPGTLTGQSTWVHDCFQADLEGYGNPRIHDHQAFGATTFVHEPIDIGADELGELVIAGYRMMSTTFLRLDDGHPELGYPPPTNDPLETMPRVANDRLVYLGPSIGVPALPAIVAQPDYRWLQHYQNTTTTSFPLTAYPGSYGEIVTWHSGEIPADYVNPPYANFSTARPFYALRNQRDLVRRQPLPVVPDLSLATPSTILELDLMVAMRDLGAAYRATAAEITPCLRPDVHPWWGEFVPHLQGFDLYSPPPTFFVWQYAPACSGSNLVERWTGLNLFNPFLYVEPSAQDIAPSGAGVGFTDAATSDSYVWLDETAFITGQLPRARRFQNWSTAPLQITDFNIWGVGGTTLTPANNVRSVLLPSTAIATTSNPELAALRFSIEWPESVRLWQGAANALEGNLQSFLVVIDGPVVAQNPPTGPQ